MIEEWDGSRWSLINAPSGSGGGYLFGGVSLAPDDAWMVGQTASIYDSPLTEHWDGSSLTVVPTGYTRPGSSFDGVAATSPTDVFAVGANRFTGRSFAENWDGTQWVVVRAPEIGVTDALNAVTVGAGGVPWAVGSYSRDRVNYDTLAEQWDGTAWGVVQTPNGPTSSASLFAVTPVPGTTEMWAVGTSLTSAGGSATLIELYS